MNVKDVEVTELDAVVYSRSDKSPNATISLASHAESSGQRRVPVAGSVIILIDTIASFASTSEYPQSEDAVQPAYATSSVTVAVSPAVVGRSLVLTTVITKSSFTAALLPSVQVVLTFTVPTSSFVGVPL